MKREMRPLQEILDGSDFTEPKELANAMRVSTPTVYAWVRAGSIPYIKFGQLVRFDPVELRAWLDRSKAETRRSRRVAA